jgi:hypothetical protein
MKPQTYIESIVEYMFNSKNEQNIMLAYLLRTKLNWTPVQVGRYLKLSVNQVNQLNTARLHMLSSDKYEHIAFAVNHTFCEEACAEYIVYKYLRRFESKNMITRERLEKRLTELQN